MMSIFYKKQFPEMQVSVKKLKFGGFTTERTDKTGILTSEGENCDMSDGRILPGMGFSEYLTDKGTNPPTASLNVPPAVFALLPSYGEDGTRGERIMYISESGSTYVLNKDTDKFTYVLKSFGDTPAVVCF